jgi:tetratricopeptide (TPR) repeat protein
VESLDQILQNALQCHQAGDLQRAQQLYRQILGADPGHVDALHFLGVLAGQIGAFDAAVSNIRQSLRIQPNQPSALSNLANVLSKQGKWHEAQRCLEDAIGISPASTDALNNLGSLLVQIGKPEQAQPCYERLIQLQPDRAQGHINLGKVLEQQGHVERAIAEFHHALRLQPDLALAYHSLSELAKNGQYRFSDSELAALKSLAERPNLGAEDGHLLNFAMANVLDKQGDHDAAFARYRRGNEIRRQILQRAGQGFQRDGLRRSLDRLLAVCTPNYFDKVRGIGSDSELPLFIVGMPRSGTTLVEQIVSSHPRVVARGEAREIPALVNALIAAAGGVAYPDCLTSTSADTVNSLANKHLQNLEQIGTETMRVTDKLPENFLHLGLIVTLFPRAKIIHCRRDPMDTCVSCYLQNFANANYAFTLDLGDLGFAYREYERLMAHWRQVLPLPMFEVSYEDLVTNQEAVSRQLIAYCGLDWDDCCLAFHKNPRPVQTASMNQVRQPAYQSSIGRWKRYERHLQPLIDALGDFGPHR